MVYLNFYLLVMYFQRIHAKNPIFVKDLSKIIQSDFVLDCFDKDWSDVLQLDQQGVNLNLF